MTKPTKFYAVREHLSRDTAVTLDINTSFTNARLDLINKANHEGWKITGYHLTEMFNTPCHALFYISHPDGTIAVYTISECEPPAA